MNWYLGYYTQNVHFFSLAEGKYYFNTYMQKTQKKSSARLAERQSYLKVAFLKDTIIFVFSYRILVCYKKL